MFLAAPLLLALCAAAAAAPDLTQLEFQAEVSQRDTFGDQGLKFTFPKASDTSPHIPALIT